MLVWTFYPP